MTSCDRRTVLRGLGTAVTLPWLEAFRGGSSAHAASSLSATPLRSAFMFIPNGVHAPDWIPEQQVHGEHGLTLCWNLFQGSGTASVFWLALITTTPKHWGMDLGITLDHPLAF